MRTSSLAAVPFICLLMSVGTARAQRGTGDWMTSGTDAQRSSWVKSDPKISRESMQKPGFALVWKLKFENSARQLNTITPPALLDFYIGYRGFRTLGFFGLSSDRVIAIDTDIARTEWEKKLGTGTAPAGTFQCPGGMTSAVTRPTSMEYPGVPTPRGAGRATPAKSGVGLPYEGAVTLKRAPVTQAKPVAPAKPAAPAANPFAARIQYVLALAGDGKLHSLYVSNGEEPKPPVSFIPANANAHGLIAFENTAYVATAAGCPGVDSGIWALDLPTGKVSRWKSPGKGVAGNAGPAAGPDGTLYVAGGGGELTALAPRTLKSLASYKTGGPEFTSSPVVFEYKDKDLIAVATSDGSLHLLDTAALNSGAPLDKAPSFSAPDYAAGALASWEDPAGTRWILAPASGQAVGKTGSPSGNGEVKNGAIIAWKVVEKDGAPRLQPGWVSRDLISPLPPIIVNGVVFALSSGEFRSSDQRLSAAQRAQRSSNAVLYALDGLTGKELWNSGTTITSFVHSGGLAAGGGRVYVGTYEGTQYAFGFPMEH